MRIATALKPRLVLPDLQAADRQSCIRDLVAALAEVHRLDPQRALRDIEHRERSGPILLPRRRWNVALPHAFTLACQQLVLAVGTSRTGIPWAKTGEKAHVVFLFLGPPQTQGLYLRFLTRVARMCEDEEFLDSLVEAPTAESVIACIAEREKPRGEIRDIEGLPSFCVLGAGHGGLAMAGHLALTGCKVKLYNRSPERIEAVAARMGIQVEGEVDGFAELNAVTTDPAEALDQADVLMVVVPATAHRDIALAIAPHLRDGQILVLNPGRTGGALEVTQVIRQVNPTVRPYIAEAQTLLYASRIVHPGQVRIFSIKNSVPIAALPSYIGPDILPVIRKALPQFIPGDNVLKTSMENIGAVFHPAITILNAGRIEDTHGDFDYYVQGVTPTVASVLEAVDRERVAVAGALGIRAHSAREWLYFSYDAAGKTLLDAIHANRAYVGIKAPPTMQHRYISEDVPASLVPIASIGEMLGVQTPTIRALIRMASVMHDVDYWATGRTVDKLGLEGLSVKEIRFLIAGVEAAETE
ncbi:MAG: NAD/NADP octopine/nopaline dehydrogenase family protein [Spirochaetales bacterium]|nr:NAD/NADP octopine/nopaline dehydrogenase family protein [Spirochaetales bacterium]